MTVDASPDIGLDHIGIFGHDLTTLSRCYEQLGFSLTPLSQHARPAAPGQAATLRGTANRCAMLQRGYIELLAVVDPSLDTLGVPQALSRYAGLHIVAFDIEDAQAAKRQLAGAGIGFTETYLERDVETPTGLERAKFTQIKPDANRFPEGRVFMLRHETRELVWQPQQLRHANTAVRLKDVIVAVDDPATAGERYESYLGCKPRQLSGLLRYTLADGTFFTLAEPRSLQALYSWANLPALPMPVAMIIEVHDLGTAESVIRGNGVNVGKHEGRLIVDAHEAAGVMLILEQQNNARPA